MTLPHMTQMWLTEVLQTTTPQGKCPPCGPVQETARREALFVPTPDSGLQRLTHPRARLRLRRRLYLAGRLRAFA